MSINWRLKSYLSQKHQIYTVTEFQKRIVKKTGVLISLAQLCKLVNREPKVIRLETIEILCSALECGVAEFLNIAPRKMNPHKTRKLSYKNTPLSKIGVKAFPEPEDYQ